jgi:hypothetical protein
VARLAPLRRRIRAAASLCALIAAVAGGACGSSVLTCVTCPSAPPAASDAAGPRLTVTIAGSAESVLAGEAFTSNGRIAMMFANQGAASDSHLFSGFAATADVSGSATIQVRLNDLGDLCADRRYHCPSLDFDVWAIDVSTGRGTNRVTLRSHSFVP